MMQEIESRFKMSSSRILKSAKRKIGLGTNSTHGNER